MFCMHCGNQVQDGVKFCENCGKPIQQAEAQSAAQPAEQQAPAAQPAQGAVIQQGAPMPDRGASTAQTQAGQGPVYTEAAPKELGTKWLKCLPFLLGIGALVNLAQLFQLADGYDLFLLMSWPGSIGTIITINVVSVVLLIVFAVLAAVMLYKRKKSGPMFAYLCYLTEAALGLVMMIGASSLGMDSFESLGMLIGGAVMLVLNVIYFQKRQHLFH